MIYDLIIVGAGAAGLFAAANAPSGKTLLLEKMDSPGRKILISGAGMCNLTNCDDPDDFIQAFGSRRKANFLKPSLYNLSPQKTRSWFEQMGLPLTVREDGKVFPRSLKARSVVECLKSEALKRGVELRFSSPVESLTFKDEIFAVSTPKEEFSCRRVLLTTGGKSFESTGSDGSGYALARSLGHKIVEPTQALVPLFIDNYDMSDLAGSSLRDITVDFFHAEETKRYFQGRGDLLFTHKGISGPVILNNSRLVRSGDRLSVSLIPCGNREDLRKTLADAFEEQKTRLVKTVLKNAGIFTALAEYLLASAEVRGETVCSGLAKKKRNRLISLITDFPMTVSRKGYFSSAMATAGGVNLENVNRKTMESKLCKGLFFAGEVLDLDGHTGGYNIQAAFSTAFSALSALSQ